ncbi:EAF family protein [Abortiporus biennis]
MASNSSMPTEGRLPVDIGSSLSRALKARRGPVPKARVEREFYTFRYNMIPQSVDTTKPGTVEVQKGKDSTSVTVERASVQPGDGGYSFNGPEIPHNQWDCVLIFDQETGRLLLEKVDTYVNLRYDRRVTHTPRLPGSPLPSRQSVSSHPTPEAVPLQSKGPSTSAVDDLEAELNEELLGMDDAEGEPDDEFLNPTPVEVPPPPPAEAPTNDKKGKGKARDAVSSQAKKNRLPAKGPLSSALVEDDDESEREVALSRLVAPKAPSPKKSKPNLRATGSSAKTKESAATTTTTKTNGVKRHAEPETETLELPKPAARSKRARPSPPPSSKVEEDTFSLALPTGSGPGLSLPGEHLSLPGSLSRPTAATSSIPAPPPPDSDEEDWDAVDVTATPAPAPSLALPSHSLSLVMEEIDPALETPKESQPLHDPEEEQDGVPEEEIDMDAFMDEMNEHQWGDANEEEDFLQAAVAESPTDSPVADRQPMSLSQMAGGGLGWDDDDSSTSEDDSDDDD